MTVIVCECERVIMMTKRESYCDDKRDKRERESL